MDVSRFFAPPHPFFATRREFLKRAGNGAGMLALASLLAREGRLAPATARVTPDLTACARDLGLPAAPRLQTASIDKTHPAPYFMRILAALCRTPSRQNTATDP